MTAYYNEIDPFAAQWMRNLIKAGHIADGEVDERSITEVSPDDVRGFAQCHFFAGIGGWSYAMRLARWSDDRFVWTGSCPCQPFSVAGAQRGAEDERHLWPAFFNLIRERRPPTVIGEQVAGAAGLAWLDHVCADLEGEDYAVAAADLPACSVGAPHRRQRLFWVADSDVQRGPARCGSQDQRWSADGFIGSGTTGRVDDSESISRRGFSKDNRNGYVGAGGNVIGEDCTSCGLGDAESIGRQRRTHNEDGRRRECAPRRSGPWDDLEWLPCADGKARPTGAVEPEFQQVAHGLSDKLGLMRSREKWLISPLCQGSTARVGRLRAYGNAIVPSVASEFISAFMECRP